MPRTGRLAVHWRLASAVSVASAVLSGCGESDRRRGELMDVVESTGEGGARRTAGAFHGRIVPRTASELRAPQNVFKIAGWHSSSTFTELSELAAEGKKVAKGDVVARFRFRHQRAKTWIDEKLQRAIASQKQSAIDQARRKRELTAEQDRKVIAAQQAELNTLKAPAISRRQLQLYRIDHRIAAFEARAAQQRLAAAARQAAAEQAYQQQNVDKEQSDVARYERYVERYVLRAPHAGVVRHAYHRQHKRKMRKGDGMKAGAAVLFVAHGSELAVRFFVPEHRIAGLRVGSRVSIRPLTGDGERQARVQRVDNAPQELGSLREDETLPNAREKAYAVRAVLDDGGVAFAAGNEVRVRLHERRPAEERSAMAQRWVGGD